MFYSRKHHLLEEKRYTFRSLPSYVLMHTHGHIYTFVLYQRMNREKSCCKKLWFAVLYFKITWHLLLFEELWKVNSLTWSVQSYTQPHERGNVRDLSRFAEVSTCILGYMTQRWLILKILCKWHLTWRFSQPWCIWPGKIHLRHKHLFLSIAISYHSDFHVNSNGSEQLVHLLWYSDHLDAVH